MREAFVLLDDSRPHGAGLRVFTHPFAIVTAQTTVEVAPALEALSNAVKQGFFAAGYFAYELGYALEPRLTGLMPEGGQPLLWFGLFESPQHMSGAQAEQWLTSHATGRAYAGPLAYGLDEAGYAQRFAKVRDYIFAGDVYQVNLTFPAPFAFQGDPLALYARLRQGAQTGHAAYVDDGERTILSFSPELFFSVRDGEIFARPMKGTAPRGNDLIDDARIAAALKASEKDRAENLMIVDLIRNDLGRVAKTGTVRVEDLFAVETYPTVHQMVSTVRAQLSPNVSPADLVHALFPCGSITGAPKVRAMEIIHELETTPRGVYCGAVGCFAPDGSADFNVAIRTLTMKDGQGYLGIGGGIVADSSANGEYQECLVKARFFEQGRPPLGLIETLRYDAAQGFARLPLHLDRLARSAAAFGIPFDRTRVEAALSAVVEGAAGPLRVRLQVDEDGSVQPAAQPFTLQEPQSAWRYRISSHPVQSTDVLLRHKTTWRSLYDDERAAANREGCEEVVFLNERGEVAEGSMTNVFIRRDGRLLTPAASCGLLDGCLRRELLDSGGCEEAVLFPSDLDGAEVYFGNSLRGLIRAESFTSGTNPFRP